MTWQPIESAPKSGEFLVFGGEWEGEIHNDDKKQGVHLVVWSGRFEVKGTDCYSAWINNPTHWMALQPDPDE